MCLCAPVCVCVCVCVCARACVRACVYVRAWGGTKMGEKIAYTCASLCMFSKTPCLVTFDDVILMPWLGGFPHFSGTTSVQASLLAHTYL